MLNGMGEIDIFPFNGVRMETHPGRDDVGIVPYIPSELHSIQPGALKPSGFGRLVAAPTGGRWARAIQPGEKLCCGAKICVRGISHFLLAYLPLLRPFVEFVDF